MVSRRCSICREAKTIRGVWYILPPSEEGPDFVCEACMRRSAPPLAAV